MPRKTSPAPSAVSRRAALAGAAAAAAALAAPRSCLAAAEAAAAVKGRLRQSVSKWCFDSWWSLETLAANCAKIGIKGIDLIGANDWPTVKKHGLTPTMAPGAGSISNGWNRKDNHDRFVEEMKRNLDLAAEAGVPNVICMSGERKGLPDDEGIKNCVEGLKRVAGYAERKKVTMCMELLNSKVDHKDYQCDRTAWGVEVVKGVGSPRFKLLYDIYHMQIMEGDVIRTITDNIQHIGHFHTAGNPGRKDLDEEQELFYPAIMRAIAKLTEEGKYNGYVAHEFGAKKGLDSIRQAIQLCDV